MSQHTLNVFVACVHFGVWLGEAAGRGECL